ncbi:6824_t:CDS:2 [Dentiscutata heterogama]|uniref:6824_t:CDS:1 n=1 Tax=Dentiscutata heterogama TaxID=1316150 RepID=A0ACA9K4W3_9GLOM|nr:6824_t:CDS:2 [Dentiscutata heterogama]
MSLKTTLIFDFDGLLVNSEKEYFQIISKIFKTFQVDYKWSDHAEQLGKTRQESNTILVNIINEKIINKSKRIKVDDFKKIRKKFIPKFNDLELIPYVKEFVENLHKAGVKIVIATNSSRDEFEKKTTKFIDFISIFDEIFCGDDVEVTKFGYNNKYKAVLNYMSLSPKECLVFEDSPHGVYLASSQNIDVIWVQDKLMKEYFECNHKDLCEHDNVHIFSSFKDNQ